MNKHTNFLSMLIGSDVKASEQEIAHGLAALKAAGVAIQQVPTQADGSFKCGRNKECIRGKESMRSSGYILSPSHIVEVDVDTKDAGWASAFSIGRMDDKSGVVRVPRGRYHVELADAFLALAGVVIADNEIYKEDLIPQIIERINAAEIISEDKDMADNVSSDMSAEDLKAARKAAKQAEKAAKVAAKKGR